MALSGEIASISLILCKKKNINSINYTMGRLSVPKKILNGQVMGP